MDSWDDLLEKMPDDPYSAVMAIADFYFENKPDMSPDTLWWYYDAYLFARSYFTSLPPQCLKGSIILNVFSDDFDPSGSPPEVENLLAHRFKLLYDGARALLLPRRKEHIAHLFDGRFSYKFTDDDYERVQQLVNELRDLIAKSEVIEEDHRRRLLRRLDKLQSELHKTMSSLDRFWGLVGDAGVVLGKFGEDVKPVVDRITELMQIVWRVQSMSESLGLLPPPSNVLQEKND